MSDNVPAALGQAILGSVALGYAPVIDRQRNILATRLTSLRCAPRQALTMPPRCRAERRLAWQGGELLSPQERGPAGRAADHPPAEPVQIEVPAFVA